MQQMPVCVSETRTGLRTLERRIRLGKTSETERQVREEREPVKQGLSRAFKHFRQKVLKRNKLPELIEKYIPGGRVLDIGQRRRCAGHLPTKYQPHGIEVSKALAQAASEVVEPRGGSIMHDNALNGIQKLPENHFAGVLMSAFLEHEVEPNGLLQGVAKVLQPGGVVIIKVPNYGSWNRKIRAEKMVWLSPARPRELLHARKPGSTHCSARHEGGAIWFDRQAAHQ